MKLKIYKYGFLLSLLIAISQTWAEVSVSDMASRPVLAGSVLLTIMFGLLLTLVKYSETYSISLAYSATPSFKAKKPIRSTKKPVRKVVKKAKRNAR